MTQRIPRALGAIAICSATALGRSDASLTGADAPQQAATTVAAPPGASYFGLTPQFAISPDGRQVVSVAEAADGVAMLWVQPLAAGPSRAVAGTEQASYPFWSADSRFVGFFAGGKLKKVAVAGGQPSVICDAPSGRGGTWNAADVVVFAAGIGDPLRQVPAAGGSPSPVTVVDTARENSHRWPQFLPDDRHVIFWAGAGSAPPELKIVSLTSRESRSLGPADTNAAFGGGHVFYGRRNVLMALPFDPVSLQPRGEPVRVAEPLSGDAGSNFGSFSVSSTGTLLYSRGSARPLLLTWFDRSGRKLGTIGQPGQYTNVALSPDDKHIAVSLTAGTPPNRDIWMMDAETGVSARLTTDPAVDATPVWSPDGREIVFSSQRAGPYQMYRRPSTADGEVELLLQSDVATVATDWARNPSLIIYTRTDKSTGLDLWGLQVADRQPIPGIATAAAEDNGALGGPCPPGGRALAYQSSESGKDEVYLRCATVPMPGSSVRIHVSANGGTQPLWRVDRQELFFLAPDGSVMSAAIKSGGELSTEPAQKLFKAPVSLVIRRSYAVSSDGQRFLFPILDNTNPPVITIDRNWSGR